MSVLEELLESHMNILFLSMAVKDYAEINRAIERGIAGQEPIEFDLATLRIAWQVERYIKGYSALRDSLIKRLSAQGLDHKEIMRGIQ